MAWPDDAVDRAVVSTLRLAPRSGGA